MFCVSRNAYKMIIFAHSKCKRYENRKIQGVALPKKERNGQEWKSSHHGTHHGEQDYGAVLLQVVLHSIALESSCQPIGGQEQGSRGNQQGHRAVVAFHPKGFRCTCGKENGLTRYTLFHLDISNMMKCSIWATFRHYLYQLRIYFCKYDLQYTLSE